MKPANTPKKAAGPKRFSLVPPLAQQKMYKALSALRPASPEMATGAEVAEVAICLALGESDPVIVACPAVGARTVRKGCKTIGNKGELWAAATLAAVAALLADPKATALVCVGQLDCRPEAQENYRNAFGFAARHKLPILFLVANALTPGRPQQPDLRTLYAELGIPVFSVDANDAIAAYRIATESLHNARHMRGPCVIEALTVRGNGVDPISSLDLLRDYMERHGNPPI
jgi:hypothetical protein